MRKAGLYDHKYTNEVDWFDNYKKWKASVQAGLDGEISKPQTKPQKEIIPSNPIIIPIPDIVDPLDDPKPVPV